MSPRPAGLTLRDALYIEENYASDDRLLHVAREIRRECDSVERVAERHPGFLGLATRFKKLTGYDAPPLTLDPRDITPKARDQWRAWRNFCNSPEERPPMTEDHHR